MNWKWLFKLIKQQASVTFKRLFNGKPFSFNYNLIMVVICCIVEYGLITLNILKIKQSILLKRDNKAACELWNAAKIASATIWCVSPIRQMPKIDRDKAKIEEAANNRIYVTYSLSVLPTH